MCDEMNDGGPLSTVQPDSLDLTAIILGIPASVDNLISK